MMIGVSVLLKFLKPAKKNVRVQRCERQNTLTTQKKRFNKRFY